MGLAVLNADAKRGRQVMAQARRREELAGQRRRDAPCEPGDEVCGEWSAERLAQMDRAFRAAIEREVSKPGLPKGGA
jgi:hypothetical protein